MAREIEIENASDRLDKLREKKEKREHEEAVSRAGFDNADDYDAWRVLEDLRTLTLSERRAAEAAAAELKAASGGITIRNSLRDAYYGSGSVFGQRYTLGIL